MPVTHIGLLRCDAGRAHLNPGLVQPSKLPVAKLPGTQFAQTTRNDGLTSDTRAIHGIAAERVWHNPNRHRLLRINAPQGLVATEQNLPIQRSQRGQRGVGSGPLAQH